MWDWMVFGIAVTIGGAGIAGVGALIVMSSSFQSQYRGLSLQVSDAYYTKFEQEMRAYVSSVGTQAVDWPRVRSIAYLGAVANHHDSTSMEGSGHLMKAALALLGGTVVATGWTLASGSLGPLPFAVTEIIGAIALLLYAASGYFVYQHSNTRSAIDHFLIKARQGRL